MRTGVSLESFALLGAMMRCDTHACRHRSEDYGKNYFRSMRKPCNPANCRAETHPCSCVGSPTTMILLGKCLASLSWVCTTTIVAAWCPRVWKLTDLHSFMKARERQTDITVLWHNYNAVIDNTGLQPLDITYTTFGVPTVSFKLTVLGKWKFRCHQFTWPIHFPFLISLSF